MNIEEFYEAETIAFRRKQKEEADAFETQLKERIIERFGLPKAGEKVTLNFELVTLKNVQVVEVVLHFPRIWVKVDTDDFAGVIHVPLEKIAKP